MRRALQAHEKSLISFLAEQACEQETSSEISHRSMMRFRRVSAYRVGGRSPGDRRTHQGLYRRACQTLMHRRSWLRSALLESFLLFRSILRPARKGPEAHEGVGEDRTPGHSQQF